MKYFIFLFLTACSLQIRAQVSQPRPPLEADAPAWVQVLYAPQPNVFAIQEAYDAYYATHPFVEDNYTRYYQRWAILARPFVQENGDVQIPQSVDRSAEVQKRKELRSTENARMVVWTYAGPEINYTRKYADGDPFEPISDHANIYSIDRSLSDPNVLYCGGETGGIYKTTDQAMTWEHVTQGYYINTVRAIAIHPTDIQTVIASADGDIWKTTNGGASWYRTGDAAFQALTTTAYDILFNPGDPSIVYASCEQGFYRSTDGGENWTLLLNNWCMSVATKPDDPSIVYTLQYDPAVKIPYFKKSTDYGATFTTYADGWFSVPPEDAGKITSYGGRIAVTEANPDKVYVLLVGESDATAVLQLKGTIGVYMSADAGEHWSFPHGLLGMPYALDTHPNLMDFDGHSSDYDQIYYNTTLAVSQLDENKLLIGGLNLWKSEDGAVSYDPVGGYIGYLPYYHPDNQETKIYKTSPTTEEIWMATDGGVNYTDDWVSTHESRCFGLRGGNFWGFDQGWGEDIMVGGRYHNGNGGYFEDYPDGHFIALGGGEAATGYVSPDDSRKCLFSDIGGIQLPEEIDGVTGYFSFTNTPNESYWYNSSSRVQFDWNYYSYAYMGRDNSFWKSTDGGASFTVLYTFGLTTGNKVLWVEQSRVDPKIIYCTQNIGGSNCFLWKSTDGGISWENVDLPLAKRDLNFTLSGTNADELWIAYTYGPNGSKIYHSTNGGFGWDNITTSTLDDLHPTTISAQFGTDGGVYVSTREAAVFYRTNTFIDWLPYSDQLPIIADPLKLIPFYRDEKIRLATWDCGIWEAPLYESSGLIADFSAEKPYFFCAGDAVHFIDRSTGTDNATFYWEFPGATPSTSTEKNPTVVYNSDGIFSVTHSVTDGGVTESITKENIVASLDASTLPLQEDFEVGSFANGWHGGATGGWAVDDWSSAYDVGSHSMWFNNYWTDLHGGYVDEISAKYDMFNILDAQLHFDVAYAPYGGIYVDSLQVFVSTDCGNTLTSVYYKGGDDLATAPAYTPDIFYPTADQWRTETIDLNPFLGAENITLVFRNIGHWGQALYVDNINIDATVDAENMQNDPLQVSVQPNPNNGQFVVNLQVAEAGTYTCVLRNATGSVVQNKAAVFAAGRNTFVFNEQELAAGCYYLQIINKDLSITKKVIIQ
ncbi:MAG: T9SS type A sorting domain-containing protein [Chitinophagales bacterium]